MNLNSVDVVPQCFSFIKVDTMLSFVSTVLFVIPFKFHKQSIPTICKIATNYLHLVNTEANSVTFQKSEDGRLGNKKRGLKNPIDSQFYDFCQFFRKEVVKLTPTKEMDGKYPLQDLGYLNERKLYQP